MTPKLRTSSACPGSATVPEGGSDEDITPTCEQPPAIGGKTFRNDDKLQYLDLDHSSTPQRQPPRKLSASSIGNLFTIQRPPEVEASGSERGIVYKTVDFVKTEAFKMVRQDAENRAANRSKDWRMGRKSKCNYEFYSSGLRIMQEEEILFFKEITLMFFRDFEVE